MLKQRRDAVEQIAATLWDAETAIDLAITKTAALTGCIPSLRKQAGASALIGQDAIARASQAVVALAEARQMVVEAHKELSVAKIQIGLGAVAIGDDGGGKPPTGVVIEENEIRDGRHLRPVRAA